MSNPFPDVASIPIAPMEPGDALAVARLFGDAMPWSIFSKLGPRFNARFIRWIQQQENSEVLVAKGPDGRVLGINGASLDKPGIYRRIVREHLLRISLHVLLNLYRPGVLAWIFRAIRERLRPSQEVPRTAPRPAAEGIFLAVVEEARGTGLAYRLHLQMEANFRKWGLKGPYVVLFLSDNERIHAFHKRHGAKFVAKVPTRGHLIYEYHKELPPEEQ